MKTLLAALAISALLATGPPTLAKKNVAPKKKAPAIQKITAQPPTAVLEVQYSYAEVVMCLTANDAAATQKSWATAGKKQALAQDELQAATSSGTNEVLTEARVYRAIGIFFTSTTTSSRYSAPLTGFS